MRVSTEGRQSLASAPRHFSLHRTTRQGDSRMLRRYSGSIRFRPLLIVGRYSSISLSLAMSDREHETASVHKQVRGYSLPAFAWTVHLNPVRQKKRKNRVQIWISATVCPYRRGLSLNYWGR